MAMGTVNRILFIIGNVCRSIVSLSRFRWVFIVLSRADFHDILDKLREYSPLSVSHGCMVKKLERWIGSTICCSIGEFIVANSAER